ncbi:non-specific phospholipase C1 [Actinidia rufa]|uniref:Non-specific phospholipase C1 n=1 Tax=Actinidia rufa TaxID=165716 RepID=A0A7J0H9J3_9ERIC|nr:non-specific phospholipase C1 [Actinidia rufa]
MPSTSILFACWTSPLIGGGSENESFDQNICSWIECGPGPSRQRRRRRRRRFAGSTVGGVDLVRFFAGKAVYFGSGSLQPAENVVERAVLHDKED